MANIYLGEQPVSTVAVVASGPGAMKVTDDGNGNVTIVTNGANISVETTE